MARIDMASEDLNKKLEELKNQEEEKHHPPAETSEETKDIGDQDQVEEDADEEAPEESSTTYAVKLQDGDTEEVSKPVYDLVKHLKEELSNAKETISAKDNTITQLHNQIADLKKNAQVGNR